MKKIILASIILTLILPACNKKLEKPFIIVNKSYKEDPISRNLYFEYTYQESSKDAFKTTFTDVNNYEIGDTLAK
jgi:hypothetical protein